MPNFICDKCGCIENTATSNYWMFRLEGKPLLCSECDCGKWHNMFHKKHWTEYGREKLLADKRYVLNAESYFKEEM